MPRDARAFRHECVGLAARELGAAEPNVGADLGVDQSHSAVGDELGREHQPAVDLGAAEVERVACRFVRGRLCSWCVFQAGATHREGAVDAGVTRGDDALAAVLEGARPRQIDVAADLGAVEIDLGKTGLGQSEPGEASVRSDQRRQDDALEHQRLHGAAVGELRVGEVERLLDADAAGADAGNQWDGRQTSAIGKDGETEQKAPDDFGADDGPIAFCGVGAGSSIDPLGRSKH